MQQQLRVQLAFGRAAEVYDQHARLQREVADRLLQRLDYMKLMPHNVLDAGAGSGYSTRGLSAYYPRARIYAVDLALPMLRQLYKTLRWRERRRIRPVNAALEALPFAEGCFDLIFSSLTLQWCTDLPQVLREFHRVLRPGGALLFTSLGPDTLHELRESWAAVDGYMHVNHFVDMHMVGDSLLQTGFTNPVMDVERITLMYTHVRELMRDLKCTGANTVLQRRRTGLLGKQQLLRLEQAYEAFRQDVALPATYEVVYGHGWGSKPLSQAQAGTREQPIRWLKG